MSQLLDRERTEVRWAPPARKRVPVLEYALLGIGALLTLFGVYSYYVPAGWAFGDLAEGWRLASLVLGGLTLSGGFTCFADRMRRAHGDGSWLVTAGIVLALASFAVAITFAAILVV